MKNELLIVNNVTFSDAGIYQCNAVNIVGENAVNFSLNVSSPPLLEMYLIFLYLTQLG